MENESHLSWFQCQMVVVVAAKSRKSLQLDFIEPYWLSSFIICILHNPQVKFEFAVYIVSYVSFFVFYRLY